MLKVDDIRFLFVELNHQPEEKHSLWFRNNMCIKLNKTQVWYLMGLGCWTQGPERKLWMQDPG